LGLSAAGDERLDDSAPVEVLAFSPAQDRTLEAFADGRDQAPHARHQLDAVGECIATRIGASRPVPSRHVGLVIHASTYIAVNALLVLIWAVRGDSDWSIGEALSSPISATRSEGFWPLWVIAAWGVLLAVHTAVAVQTGRVRRRRRRRARRDARRHRPISPAPPVEPLPRRRWVAVLFTDVVGSSQLAETLGDEEWSDVVAAYRSVVRAVLHANGGSEVGTQGDGFLLRFDHPDDAVRCAIALQRRFDAERQADRFTPQVRMGLHAGEAVGAEEGDIIGRSLNVAARVTSLAGSGEILVTEPVADYLGPGVALEDRGLQELRGIGQTRHVLAVHWREDDSDLPLADDRLREPDHNRLSDS
jgi:class 3 adenylate cyclase